MMTLDMFLQAQQRSEIVPFEPTRREELDRLKKIASHMGAHDAIKRDPDLVAGNNRSASAPSPWLEHSC